MHGNVRRVDHELALIRKNRTAVIQTLLHVHATRCLSQRCAHLCRDRCKTLVKYLQQNRICSVQTDFLNSCCGRIHPRHHDLAARGHPRLPTGFDDDRGNGFGHYRGAGDAIARNQVRTLEHGYGQFPPVEDCRLCVAWRRTVLLFGHVGRGRQTRCSQSTP